MGISDIHWNFRAALAALFIITFTNTTLAFQNIAKEAIISTSSSLDGNEGEKVVDGIIRLDGKGEWACVGERKAWGANKLPWIQLDWNKERTINSRWSS